MIKAKAQIYRYSEQKRRKKMKKYHRTETVMTYDQWKHLYRKNIKKMIRDTVTSGICWLVISGMTLMIPGGMFVHWLLVGY